MSVVMSIAQHTSLMHTVTSPNSTEYLSWKM